MPRHISAPPRRRLAARPHAAAAPITTSPRLGGASRPLAVASLAAAAPCPCCPSLRHASAFQIQTVPCRREPVPCSARPMLRRATPSLDCPPPEHAPADRYAALAQQSFASPLLISAAPSPRAAGQRHYLTNPCCSARCPCDAGQSLAFASLSGPKLRLTIAMLRLSMPGPLNAYLRQRISMPLPANAMLSPAPDHALPLPL